MANGRNLFHRGHYNKTASVIGRLDISDEDKRMITEKFADMFEKDYPFIEGEQDGFQRDMFYDAVNTHYQTYLIDKAKQKQREALDKLTKLSEEVEGGYQ